MKKNDLLKKLGMILLSSIIIIFSLIIGANEKGLRVLPISILLLLIIIFLVCKKISNKKESIFFKNKIDITVFIFIISTFLPLIFKTYSSLSYQIEFMVKYVFYYSVYILSRNVIKTKKDINIIFSVIIFTSIIPIILGLDIISERNTFSFIIKKLNLLYDTGYKPTFNFGYSNVVAIYLSLCTFLSIYKIYNTKEKLVKILYGMYIILALYCIYLCYSRMPSILLIIFLSIFFINKYKDKIKEYKSKIIKIGVVSLLILIPIICYGLTISKEFTTTMKEYEKVVINDYKQDEKYKLELDVEFYATEETKTINKRLFKVDLVSINKYYKETIIESRYYGIGNKKIVFEFTPLKDTDDIRFYIHNENNGGMKIKKVYLNNKEIIYHYKYLPQNISKFVSFITLKDKSLVERYYFYKDSMKIFKKHMIFGNGGDAWHSLSKSNQDYTFSVKETHSYFFELLIEYGLVGLLCYYVMLTNIMIILFKNTKEEKKILRYALVILLLHSITFDFNMSYMFIEIIVYTLFACILTDEKKDKTINTKYDYPIFIILFITLLSTTYMSLYQYSIIDGKYYLPINRKMIESNLKILPQRKSKPKEKLDFLKTTMKYEPYLAQNYIYHYYFDILLKNEKSISNKEIDEYLDYITKHISKTEIYSPLYIDYLISREKSLTEGVNLLKESKYKNKDKYIKRIRKIIIDEHDQNVNYINQIERHGYSPQYTSYILEEYEKLYEEVK